MLSNSQCNMGKKRRVAIHLFLFNFIFKDYDELEGAVKWAGSSLANRCLLLATILRIPISPPLKMALVFSSNYIICQNPRSLKSPNFKFNPHSLQFPRNSVPFSSSTVVIPQFLALFFSLSFVCYRIVV